MNFDLQSKTHVIFLLSVSREGDKTELFPILSTFLCLLDQSLRVCVLLPAGGMGSESQDE